MFQPNHGSGIRIFNIFSPNSGDPQSPDLQAGQRSEPKGISSLHLDFWWFMVAWGAGPQHDGDSRYRGGSSEGKTRSQGTEGLILPG